MTSKRATYPSGLSLRTNPCIHGRCNLQGKSIGLYLAAILMALTSFRTTVGEEAIVTNDELNVVMTDEFDTGTELWTYTDRSGGSMDWDPTDGSPEPGSLRLATSEPLSQFAGFLAMGACMDTEPGDLWRIEGMVKKTGIGNCLVFIRLYDGPDCTGEGSSVGNSPIVAAGSWEVSFWEAPAFSNVYSVRPALLMSAPASAGIMSCHYDSVTVYNDRAPLVTDVPTLSIAGQLAIASLLAFIGCALLVRR